MYANEKGSFGNLMTDKTEGLIDRETNKRTSRIESEWRADDKRQDTARDRAGGRRATSASGRRMRSWFAGLY